MCSHGQNDGDFEVFTDCHVPTWFIPGIELVTCFLSLANIVAFAIINRKGLPRNLFRSTLLLLVAQAFLQIVTSGYRYFSTARFYWRQPLPNLLAVVSVIFYWAMVVFFLFQYVEITVAVSKLKTLHKERGATLWRWRTKLIISLVLVQLLAGLLPIVTPLHTVMSVFGALLMHN
eukprot:gb/GEZN01022502.1/.p1 GENE.gb/GEZN01022502.1/~~gb/GEZN01022502.1/.p1  ORF type:complete len:175 (-),score=15.77 gb/GEZN01022502.1/:11-535(-)